MIFDIGYSVKSVECDQSNIKPSFVILMVPVVSLNKSPCVDSGTKMRALCLDEKSVQFI